LQVPQPPIISILLDGSFTDRPVGLPEEASARPPLGPAALLDRRTAFFVAPVENPDSPAVVATYGAQTQTVQQPAIHPYPIFIQDDNSWSDPWFVTWIVVAISVALGSFLLALVWLLLALRRISALQQATIRIELADTDLASLQLLANRLSIAASGGGGVAVHKAGDGGDAAADKIRPNPILRLAARPTQIADLADAPFPAAWAGPTFADTMQADQQRRLEQEEEILHSIFDRNLELVQKLGEFQATTTAT
jgi:hypothetical protein